MGAHDWHLGIAVILKAYVILTHVILGSKKRSSDGWWQFQLKLLNCKLSAEYIYLVFEDLPAII